MRYFLTTILSLLLLSSFLTSCEKKEETLYRWETSPGRGLWKTFGDKNYNPQYIGEVRREFIIFGDYIREGMGILTYPSGYKYVGEWKDGVFSGYGTYIFPDGGKYEGEWKNERKNGQGTITQSNGIKIVGEFKDGVYWNVIEKDKNGNITEKWVNGVKQ